MKKLILTAALSASFLPACLAGPIDGVVKDKKTGETLIGSVVQVKGRQDNMTTTGLDGTFTLKDLPDQVPSPLLSTTSVTNLSAKVSLLYKDTNHGWNGQLAASYTGTRLVLVSPYLDSDEWERHFFTLDLSGEKRFKNGLAIFLKANNLLNAKRERYLKTTNEFNSGIPGQPSDRTLVGSYRYGRTFLVGVRVSL